MVQINDWGVVNAPGHLFHGAKVRIEEIREDRYVVTDGVDDRRIFFHLNEIVFGEAILPIYERRIKELEASLNEIGWKIVKTSGRNDTFDMVVKALNWY